MLKEKQITSLSSISLEIILNKIIDIEMYCAVPSLLLVINKQLSCFKSDCFTCSYLHSGIFFSGLSNCKIIVGYIFIN